VPKTTSRWDNDDDNGIISMAIQSRMGTMIAIIEMISVSVAVLNLG
jgi:hypothetical protein